MIIIPFVSAGHHLRDSGAVANGMQENLKTIEFRDLVVLELKKLYGSRTIVTDNDNETLSEYLQRIKTGNGSVVCEFHFDDSDNSEASGCTGIVGVDADRLDKAFAKELTDTVAQILQIKNRGVVSEAESHRGRLGLMREHGIVALFELGFISNENDMNNYEEYKALLAEHVAAIIYKYDELIK